jgi:hypothetical protein
MSTNEEYKVIYASVTTPLDKRSKAACTTVECSNSHNCELFKRNQCILIGILNTQTCPYGKYRREEGYTKIAKSYSTWVTARTNAYKDIPKNVSGFKFKMAEVGNYMFLPYSLMNMNEEIPFRAKSSIFSNGSYLLPLEHFNIPNIIKICEYKPHALMGGEITDYQKKEIPLFLRHLSESYPNIFAELCKHYERAKQLSNSFTRVGQDAFLRTLNPNVGTFTDIHGGVWTWDGKYLTSKNSKMSFGLISNYMEVRLEPHPNSTVIVTDEKQINENTIFA